MYGTLFTSKMTVQVMAEDSHPSLYIEEVKAQNLVMPSGTRVQVHDDKVLSVFSSVQPNHPVPSFAELII